MRRMTRYVGRWFLLVFMAASTLSGCIGSVYDRNAPIEQDAEAKQFRPVPEFAQVYIYRNSPEYVGAPGGVSINRSYAGETYARTYFRIYLPAGKHEITTSNGNVRNKMGVEVENGKNYFIWQEVISGFPPKFKLKLVDEATGKKGVMESALIRNKDFFKP